MNQTLLNYSVEVNLIKLASFVKINKHNKYLNYNKNLGFNSINLVLNNRFAIQKGYCNTSFSNDKVNCGLRKL